MEKPKHGSKLAEAFEFTQEDLACNRLLEFSPRQLQKSRTNNIFIYIIVAVGASPLLLWSLDRVISAHQDNTLESNDLLVLVFLLGIAAVFFGLVVVSLLRQTRYPDEDIPEGKVAVIQGVIALYRDHRGSYVRVEDIEFSVNPLQFAAFRHAHNYRFYYEFTAKRILSVEEVA